MLRSIIYSLLNVFWTSFYIIRVLLRPVSPKVLSKQWESNQFGVILLQPIPYLTQSIVKLFNQISRIIKCLVEIFARVLARNRYVLSYEIRPPTILYNLIKHMSWKIWSMDLFWSNPNDVLMVVTLVDNMLNKLIPVVILDWRVSFEFLHLDLLWLRLHWIISFIYNYSFIIHLQNNYCDFCKYPFYKNNCFINTLIFIWFVIENSIYWTSKIIISLHVN